MKNLIDQYGINAGKIWEALNSNGSITETKLIRNTKLKNDEFYSAVGWLARENKINKNNKKQVSSYSLGETNLTIKIGGDAGRVWQTLNTWGENDISEIAEYSRIKQDEVYAALGWLSREDKIEVRYEQMKNQLNGFSISPPYFSKIFFNVFLRLLPRNSHPAAATFPSGLIRIDLGIEYTS